MNLALLVYAVNNLTYNGSFFFIVGILLILAWIGIKVFIFINNERICIPIKKGVKYKVITPLSPNTVAGTYVVATDIFQYSEKVYYDTLNEKLESITRQESTNLTQFKNSIELSKIENKIYNKKSLLYIGLLSLVMHVLLPSKQTTMYMAGAYLVENVITSDKANELGNATYDAALVQVKKWSEEAPELKEMLKPLLSEEKK